MDVVAATRDDALARFDAVLDTDEVTIGRAQRDQALFEVLTAYLHENVRTSVDLDDGRARYGQSGLGLAEAHADDDVGAGAQIGWQRLRSQRRQVHDPGRDAGCGVHDRQGRDETRAVALEAGAFAGAQSQARGRRADEQRNRFSYEACADPPMRGTSDADERRARLDRLAVGSDHLRNHTFLGRLDGQAARAAGSADSRQTTAGRPKLSRPRLHLVFELDQALFGQKALIDQRLDPLQLSFRLIHGKLGLFCCQLQASEIVAGHVGGDRAEHVTFGDACPFDQGQLRAMEEPTAGGGPHRELIACRRLDDAWQLELSGHGSRLRPRRGERHLPLRLFQEADRAAGRLGRDNRWALHGHVAAIKGDYLVAGNVSHLERVVACGGGWRFEHENAGALHAVLLGLAGDAARGLEANDE